MSDLTEIDKIGLTTNCTKIACELEMLEAEKITMASHIEVVPLKYVCKI